MNIACAVNEKNLNAIIPEKFEDAAGLLIIETDTMEIVDYVTEDWVENMVKYECEALVCGSMYDAELFEAVADACITRFQGKGLTAEDGTNKMMNYEIPIITDYVGGSGCASHGNPSNCAEHDHH